MSASDKPLQENAFAFAGITLLIKCRRLPEEVARVTQTLQLDVEELFANLLDWDIGKEEDGHAGGSGGSEQAAGQQTAAAPDSKKLCGNVASDQPDLIGLDVWPASIALCNYLAAASALVAGAAVCELGAGMGLPGLLCAKLGAAQVLLTDYEPVVVDQMRSNAAVNGVALTCSYLALDWFDLAQLAPAQRAAFDLLLLADVIYAAAVVGPLVQTLIALMKPETGAALVAHRIRRPLVFDRVDKIAKLQERDEIFEDFKVACQAAGLHLRFLNESSASLAGDEPLLLVISQSTQQLQRFPAALEEGSSEAAAAAAPEGCSNAAVGTTAATTGSATKAAAKEAGDFVSHVQ